MNGCNLETVQPKKNKKTVEMQDRKQDKDAVCFLIKARTTSPNTDLNRKGQIYLKVIISKIFT